MEITDKILILIIPILIIICAYLWARYNDKKK